MVKWPEHPDDRVDPALAPLIEAGEGEAEGFDVAETDLIEHAEHGDQHGTDPIAAGRTTASSASTATTSARTRGGRSGRSSVWRASSEIASSSRSGTSC
jgi:hypothetical protein